MQISNGKCDKTVDGDFAYSFEKWKRCWDMYVGGAL